MNNICRDIMEVRGLLDVNKGEVGSYAFFGQCQVPIDFDSRLAQAVRQLRSTVKSNAPRENAVADDNDDGDDDVDDGDNGGENDDGADDAPGPSSGGLKVKRVRGFVPDPAQIVSGSRKRISTSLGSKEAKLAKVLGPLPSTSSDGGPSSSLTTSPTSATTTTSPGSSAVSASGLLPPSVQRIVLKSVKKDRSKGKLSRKKKVTGTLMPFMELPSKTVSASSLDQCRDVVPYRTPPIPLEPHVEISSRPLPATTTKSKTLSSSSSRGGARTSKLYTSDSTSSSDPSWNFKRPRDKLPTRELPERVAKARTIGAFVYELPSDDDDCQEVDDDEGVADKRVSAVDENDDDDDGSDDDDDEEC